MTKNSTNSIAQLANSASYLQAEIERRKRNKLAKLFPDSGPLRRELYAKHLEFFRAGAIYKERCFMAGNRVGKTLAGAYETTLHLTGLYPEWWPGRRFECPTEGWAAGDTAKTVRDILQRELLGDPNERGTGVLPGDLILDMSNARGVADSIDTVWIKHASGGTSVLGFKSYSEGRISMQGTAKHLIWFDEEPPMDVYREALMRTMIVAGAPEGGICLLTFTPLSGWSDVVDAFLSEKGDETDSKAT